MSDDWNEAADYLAKLGIKPGDILKKSVTQKRVIEKKPNDYEDLLEFVERVQKQALQYKLMMSTFKKAGLFEEDEEKTKKSEGWMDDLVNQKLKMDFMKKIGLAEDDHRPDTDELIEKIEARLGSKAESGQKFTKDDILMFYMLSLLKGNGGEENKKDDQLLQLLAANMGMGYDKLAEAFKNASEEKKDERDFWQNLFATMAGGGGEEKKDDSLDNFIKQETVGAMKDLYKEMLVKRLKGETEPLTKEGKVNWDAIANRAFDTLGDLAKSLQPRPQAPGVEAQRFIPARPEVEPIPETPAEAPPETPQEMPAEAPQEETSPIPEGVSIGEQKE